MAKAKKATRKKKAAKTGGGLNPSSAIKPADKTRSKSEIYRDLAEVTGVSKKDVQAVFSGMSEMIKKDLGGKGPGIFTVPGLMKITVTKKPATKARKGVNPFTGEPTVFKAKPARKVVKIRPLKALKDMV